MGRELETDIPGKYRCKDRFQGNSKTIRERPSTHNTFRSKRFREVTNYF